MLCNMELVYYFSSWTRILFVVFEHYGLLCLNTIDCDACFYFGCTVLIIWFHGYYRCQFVMFVGSIMFVKQGKLLQIFFVI